ncbi:MAG: transcriptional regulator NrdR [Capsulimonadaceae bacterium]|nr:transcriptional regulator NrdR [Capsulimonadaceae bacterium]
MKCPFCGTVDNDKVLDSRPVRDNTAIKRRRECEQERGGCGRRFTTFETIEELQLQVIKKNGVREPFDRNKLLGSLLVALKKRPVSTAKIEEVVEDVERALSNRLDKEVDSGLIGELVMDHLRALDQVAYVRFASVYRQFEDATQFRDIVNILRRQEGRRHIKE